MTSTSGSVACSSAVLSSAKPSSAIVKGAELLPIPLLARLHGIARRRARSHADAADAVQQLLIDVWLRGANWHEGRCVLHLKSILRNQERSHASRVRREAEYVFMHCGEDLE